jgi:hypothetical protein
MHTVLHQRFAGCAVSAEQAYRVHALRLAIRGSVEQPLRAIEPQPKSGNVRVNAQASEAGSNAVKYELFRIFFKEALPS